MMNVFTELGKWIDRLAKINEQKILARDEVAKSFRHAVMESKIYLATLLNGGSRVGQQEHQVARYWSEAARTMKRDDRMAKKNDLDDLASECDQLAFLFTQGITDLEKRAKGLDKRVDDIFRLGEDLDCSLC